MITYSPIGYAKTPFKQIENVPLQGAGISQDIAELIINEEYVQGLDDLEEFSHIYVVFHIHKAAGYKLSLIHI